MKVSISITNYSWPGSPAVELSRIAQAADAAGIDTVWVADHLLQVDPFADPTHTEHLEAMTTLGYLAAHTYRVHLGTMVAGVTFRPPAVLIKAVSTLATLTGGRAWFGVGTGHQEDEAKYMGLPFPPVAQRFEQLEETLQLAHQMWSGDTSAFSGKHFQLTRPVDSPLPPARPRILVGGMGERKTLRFVAQYADACNLFDIPDGGKTVRHKLSVLAAHCADLGRDYDSIEKTIGTRLGRDETAAQFAARCDAFAELGFDHVGVITHGPWTEEAIKTVAPQ
ncbi:TIGR03560 family F420-dependent LLM class oxidoreductase [Actinocrispum sp. NPDC049592]|uniref:TIGR03560 family F420-dependent LLM class oxidoreductase n=1 Tax=Actinocrispum sp. NPDC049592 TaxID=3154835 RepID=UPI0034429B13